MTKRTAVFGLGNVLRGDDGFGPAVIRRLEAMDGWPEDVELRDLGTPGLDLAGYIAGFETVIIVDTVEGAKPGEVVEIDATDHARSAAALRVDTHAAGLQEALWLTALHDKAPERVWIVGTAAVDLGQKAGLSPEAERAVASAVYRVLERIGVTDVPAGTCDGRLRSALRT